MLHRFLLFRAVVAITSLSLPLPLFAEAADYVKVATLADTAIYPQRSAPATVVSLNDTQLSSQISAQVANIRVRVGDRVAKGQTLLELDCRDYDLAKRIAEARLEGFNARFDLATRRVQRTQQLKADQLISAEVLDERDSELAVVQADRQATQAELFRAKLNQSYCKVVSPFAALVTERIATEGQYAQPGTPLLRILDTERQEISAQIFSEDADTLQNAKSIILAVSSQRFAVSLRSVLPAVQTNTRNREVRLQFVNGQSLTGAAGKLLWDDPRPHLASELFVNRDGQLGIFTETAGKAVFLPVPTAQAGRSNPVSLSLDARVVVAGQHALEDGQSLSVNAP